MYFPSIRPGRIASAIAAAVMAASLVVTPAFADSRVVATIGADLTAEQRQTVIDYFGSSMNGAKVIYVTNADEHAHLDGYVPYEQIGNATYSCALICPTSSGGIHVRAANLNYVTADMLASALSSAGVRNADVIAICPFKVSGTGALTGVMLAYETATGTALDTTKKDVATQELVVTQSISSQVGSDAATLIVNDVKASVVMNGVTDQAQIDAIVDTTVNNIVNNTNVTNNTTNNTYVDNSSTYVDNSTTVIDNSTVNVTEVTINNNASGLSDEDIAALKQLAYSYAQAGYDYADMAETLATVSQNASAASGITDPMADQLADAAADAAQGSGDAQASSDASDGSGTADKARADATGTSEPAATTDTTASGDAAADSSTTEGAQDAPSIFDATDDGALGDDVHVTATDEGAAADTGTTDGAASDADASQVDAPAGDTAEGTDASASDPSDPFSGLNWDESTENGDQAGTTDTAATEGTPAEPAAGDAAVDGAQGETGANTDAATGTDTAQDAAFATTEADLSAAPAPAQSDGVTLTVRAKAQASALVEGTALTAFEENGAYGLADAVDGSHLTQAIYSNDFKGAFGLVVATQTADQKQVLLDSQGKQLLAGSYNEVRVLGSSWALGIQKGEDGQTASVDVYYLAGSTAQPCATLSAEQCSDAQALGEYLNVADANGGVTAYGANFAAVEGAAPSTLADFSYAAASATPATADAAETPADEAAGEPAADAAASTALPADATALVGTKDALYTAQGTDSKAHLFDAAGTELFAQGFDQVLSAHDGAIVVLVDKASDTAWIYDVTLPATQQG